MFAAVVLKKSWQQIKNVGNSFIGFFYRVNPMDNFNNQTPTITTTAATSLAPNDQEQQLTDKEVSQQLTGAYSRRDITIFRDCESVTNILPPTNSFKQLFAPPPPKKKMYKRDWRTALLSPPTYRIGNRTLRFNYYFAILLAGVIGGLIVLLFYVSRVQSERNSLISQMNGNLFRNDTTRGSGGSSLSTKRNNIIEVISYDNTYPLTPPIKGRGGQLTYRIGIVADLDTKSKVEKEDNLWRSYLKKGYLTYITPTNQVKVKWDSGEPLALESGLAMKGRGMELSELVTYNGKILSFDDRTGIIYVIENDKPLPWVILLDGDGHNAKGFKSEWATVKDGVLYVGSMGKEWTTGTGDYENENPMFIKKVLPSGQVTSTDWSNNYKRMRQEAGRIKWPGYMIHESGVWSDAHKKWYFLPRRCSKAKYNETRDEMMGCNVLISANDQFNRIETVQLDKANTAPSHGFSSFKFLPDTNDEIIIALKTEELNGHTSTYLTAFDVSGKTILPEQKLDGNFKYEGLEFL